MDYQEVCFEGEVVKLPVVQDPVTGARYVRLSDIHDLFPGVHRILLDDMIVPFMVDPNEIKYEPKRVPHHPGRLLQLIAPASMAPSTPLPRYSAIDEVYFQHHAQEQQEHQYRWDQQHERQPDTQSPRQRALQRSRTLLRAIEEQMHPRGPHTVLPDGALIVPEALLLAPMTPSAPTTNTTTMALTSVPASIERLTGAPVSQNLYKELQREMIELRQLMGHNHDEVLENFLQVLKRQQQALDRIALLQRRMEASISQVYELHEYPIPRLFIILPDPRHRWDPRRLLSVRFRLHFLCECGQHTRELVRDDPTQSRQPHYIHLAHHEGYEVTRPSEFYDQYGPYLLGMLQMIKFGCTVAGVVIPPLSHAAVMDGLENVAQTLHSSSKTLADGVDASIEYLERHLQGADPIAVYDRLSELSALEGADLRRLENFIRNTDQGKTLGNLYRITTDSGHVKWVCVDHYRSNYRESAMRSLLQSVEANGGLYDVHLQKIAITLESSGMATQFFERLVCAPGVDELELTLDYEFSSADLIQLRNVLRTTSVQSLTLDGNWRKGPLVEIKMPGRRRYDGIAGMLAHDRLRCLKLRRLVRFGGSLSSGSLVPIASALRSLGSGASSANSGSIHSRSHNKNTSGSPLSSPQSGSGTVKSIHSTEYMALGPVLRPNAISFLRTLHFLEKMDEDDQVRLATIIQGSPSLVDLRLGRPNIDLKLEEGMANATILSQQLLDAIATLPYLNVLHLHMMHMRQPTEASHQALHQIASYDTLQECKLIVYNAFSFAAQFNILAQHTKIATFQMQALALWRVGHFEKMQATTTSRKSNSVHLDFPDHPMTANDIQAVKAILSGFKLSYLSIAMPTDLNAPSRSVSIPLDGAVDHACLTSVRFSRLARGVHGQFWVAYFAALEKQQEQLRREREIQGNLEELAIKDKEKARLSLQFGQPQGKVPAPLESPVSPFRKLKSISLVQAHISAHLLQHISKLSLCQFTLFYCTIDDCIPSTTAPLVDTPVAFTVKSRVSAGVLIRSLDYSRLRLMALIELGMDSTTVDAFKERAIEYRTDLEVYIYDTELSDLDIERLSAPPLPSLPVETTPRSPQAVDEKATQKLVVDSDEEERDDDNDSLLSTTAETTPKRTARRHYNILARNKSNFDSKELNSFYAKMKLY